MHHHLHHVHGAEGSAMAHTVASVDSISTRLPKSHEAEPPSSSFTCNGGAYIAACKCAHTCTLTHAWMHAQISTCKLVHVRIPSRTQTDTYSKKWSSMRVHKTLLHGISPARARPAQHDLCACWQDSAIIAAMMLNVKPWHTAQQRWVGRFLLSSSLKHYQWPLPVSGVDIPVR